MMAHFDERKIQGWLQVWDKPAYGIDDPDLLALFKVRERIRWIEDYEERAAKKSPFHIFIIQKKGRGQKRGGG